MKNTTEHFSVRDSKWLLTRFFYYCTRISLFFKANVTIFHTTTTIIAAINADYIICHSIKLRKTIHKTHNNKMDSVFFFVFLRLVSTMFVSLCHATRSETFSLITQLVVMLQNNFFTNHSDNNLFHVTITRIKPLGATGWRFSSLVCHFPGKRIIIIIILVVYTLQHNPNTK